MSRIDNHLILIKKDSELINLLESAAFAANDNRHHSAIKYYEGALEVLNELDPEHNCPTQWADTYLRISLSARQNDNQKLSITNNILALKELRKLSGSDWTRILEIDLEIIKDLCNSDIEKKFSQTAHEIADILKSKWTELSIEKKHEVLTILIDWLYRVEDLSFAYDLQEIICLNTNNDPQLNNLLAPFDYLIIGRIANLEGEIESSSLWIKRAIDLLDFHHPTGFLCTLAYLNLAGNQIRNGDINQAIESNHLALTSINPVDDTSTRLLGEVIQGFVNIAFKQIDNRQLPQAEKSVTKAIDITIQNYELFLAHDFRTALIGLKIEILFMQRKLEEAEELLPKHLREVKLLGDETERDLGKAKYLSYRGELSFHQGDLDISYEYYRYAASVFDQYRDNIHNSVSCREKLIFILIVQERYNEAREVILHTEKFVRYRTSDTELHLAKINWLRKQIELNTDQL